MNEPTVTVELTGERQAVRSRERRVADAFVSLADTLVRDFDPVEFLHILTERVVELDLATDAGILLVDEVGHLRVVAASQERTHVLELFQLQNREGPCLDALVTAAPVGIGDLSSPGGRWPRFAPKAHAAGYRSVHALPLRLRGTVLGALNLFHTDRGEMDHADRIVAQAMADVAAIGLIQQRVARRSEVAAEQLQHALQSRTVIEQAKGVVAEQCDVDTSEAFEVMRRFARSGNRRLHDIARDVVDGALTGAELSR